MNPSVAHEFKGRVLSKEAKATSIDSKRTRAPKQGKNVAIFEDKKKDA